MKEKGPPKQVGLFLCSGSVRASRYFTNTMPDVLF